MDTTALFTLTVVGLLTPVLAWLASLLIAKAESRRILKKLRDAPLVFPGSTFARVFNAGGAEIFGPGRIAKMELGCIEIESMDGKLRMAENLKGFDSWDPVWTTTPEEVRMSGRSGKLGA